MKTAIIHYWLVNNRGGEKVLAQLCEQFPDADIYTHVYDPASMPEEIRRMPIRTTFIQKLPFAKILYKNYLPLMPWALRRLDLSDYDLIISSESGPAKGIRKPAGATHICYCHTPMRYLWDLSDDYYQNASPLKKLGMKLFVSNLRKWDIWSATQVDQFVANSQFVADRIKKIYGREANVVYPPVNVEHFQTLERDPKDFYLFFGQLTAYKRADLAIEAFNRLGKRLIVAGVGEELESLKQLATHPGLRPPLRRRGRLKLPPTGGVPERRGGSDVEIPSGGGVSERRGGSPVSRIEFLGRISDEKRDELYSQAKALIFPGVEDFGIIPVEAQAAGCPVIAFGQGGALETVVDGETGLFFHEPTADSLCNAVEKFHSMRSERGFCISKSNDHRERQRLELSEAACRANAARFSSERFAKQMTGSFQETNYRKWRCRE